MLLASVFDGIQMLLWQNANQGKKVPSKRPTPLPRPGVKAEATHFGTPMPLDEVKRQLASSRPGADMEAPV